MLVKIRHAQIAQEHPPVGVRVGPHATVALRGQLRQRCVKPAVLVEKLVRLVTLHPALEQWQVMGVLLVHEQRDLVRPERALDLLAIDDLWPGPALRRPEDDHRPARPCDVASGAGRPLNSANPFEGPVDRSGHELVHLLGLVPFDEVRVPAAAAEKLLQFLTLDARKDRGVAYLVAVEVQDRQNGAIGHRVEKLVGLPRGGQRPRLGLTVADDARDDQARIVERGAKRVAE